MKKNSQEHFDAIAALMQTALLTDDGLRALAAAIAAPITADIDQKEIASLLYTKHPLPKGELPRYQKPSTMQAFWVCVDGEARQWPITSDFVDVPIDRLHTNPMVELNVLKNGNIGTLNDVASNAAIAITKQLNRRAITTLSAAVPDANVVDVSGGVLTDTALNQGISILEDLELAPKYIIMRGRRYNDMRNWTNLDPETRREFVTKGVIKQWGTAGILLSASCALDEVIIVPDAEVGKYPVRQDLTVDAIDDKLHWKTGWLSWMDVGFGVMRPELVVKVKITA